MRLAWSAALWLSIASHAQAQVGATLETFRPSPHPDDAFGVSSGEPGRHLELTLQLYGDYANDPLVYEDVAGESGSELVSLVSDQLTLHVLASLSLLDRGLLFVDMPVNLMMSGYELGQQPTATGFGAGDFNFGGRYNFYREGKTNVAIQLTATLPTGKRGRDGRPSVSGETGATAEPEITSAIDLGPLSLLLNVGIRVRQDSHFAGTRFRDVGTAGVAFVLPVEAAKLRLIAEAEGEAPLDDVSERAGSPLQVLLGGRLQPTEELELGLAGGIGVLRGYGSPDARGVLTVAYTFALASSGETSETAEPEQGVQEQAPAPAVAAEPEPFVPPEEEVTDRDKDGISDLDDRCPILPGDADQGGCPKSISYDEMTGEIILLQAARFDAGSETLVARGEGVLAEIGAALRANPKMRVRIEAHMSRGRHGDAEQAMGLTRSRAEVVARWLVAHGVAGDQLTAMGCGANRPIVPDNGSQRFKNERLEMHVTDPLPPSGMRSTLGCDEVPVPGRAPKALTEPDQAKPSATIQVAPPKAAPTAALKPSAVTAPAPAPKPVPVAVVAAPAPAPKPAPAPLASAVAPKPAPAPIPAPLPFASAAGKPAPAAAAGPKPAAAAGVKPAAVAAVAAGTGAAAVFAALAKDPNGDADHDGVPNSEDSCTLAPGPRNPEEPGCPEGHRVDLAAGKIELLKPIRFEDGASEPSSRAAPYLDELAATLKANPKMRVVIEAHTAEESSGDKSTELTRKRARAVRQQLATRGVTPERMRAYGCGQNRPIAPNNVPWGRKKNERIEVHVLDPAPTSAVHSSEDCSASE